MSRSRRLVLRAGRLGMELADVPWSCAFVDLDSGQRLHEAPLCAGTPLGGVGFQASDSGRRSWTGGAVREEPGPHNAHAPADGRWWHAISVLDCDTQASGLSAVLATDDPRGRHVGIEVEPVADGVISLHARVVGDVSDVVATGHSFLAVPGEGFLGFGERSDAVARFSGVVEHYVGEGPWQDEEYPFLAGMVPPWGVRQRRDATYFPVPWVLSTRGYGVVVDNDEISYVRLRTPAEDAWSVEVEATSLRYRVVAGPRPLDALRRFTELTGRQGAPGERWWFGPWYQSGHANDVPPEEERRQLAALRAARAPVSAVETHCRFLPLGAHRGREESERRRTEWLHAQGLATLGYLSSMIGEGYEAVFAPAAGAGGLQRRADGSLCVFSGYAGGEDPPRTVEAQFEFASGAGRTAWAGVAAELVGCGHDGWMEDFGEYSPLDARSPSGATGTAVHNGYPRDYHRAARDVAGALEARHGRRVARFVRSGWTGSAPDAPIVWGGDPTCGWGWDGLASAVIEGLSIGASGIAMWGSDTGGFMSSTEQLTAELLCRWIQFSACCPVMRTKSSGIEVPPYRRPQIWDDDVIDTWTRWAAWHTQLNAYLRAAHAHYRAEGAPIMRALGLVWPEHADAVRAEDEYLLGDDLLVAPVLQPGVAARDVWVPPGEWVDLWRVARYDPVTRGLELLGRRSAPAASAPVVRGPGRCTVDAPIAEVPVLVRAGAVLSLLSPEVDTLADYEGAGVVRAVDRDHERRLLAWPRGTATCFVDADQCVTSIEDRHRWRLEVAPGPPRRYRVTADLRLRSVLGAPVAVDLDGVELGPRQWSCDTPGVLTVQFDCAEGVLDVRFG